MVHPYYQRDKLSRVFSADALASLRMGGGEEDTIVETLCFDFEPGGLPGLRGRFAGAAAGATGTIGTAAGTAAGTSAALHGSAWLCMVLTVGVPILAL